MSPKLFEGLPMPSARHHEPLVVSAPILRLQGDVGDMETLLQELLDRFELMGHFIEMDVGGEIDMGLQENIVVVEPPEVDVVDVVDPRHLGPKRLEQIETVLKRDFDVKKSKVEMLFVERGPGIFRIETLPDGVAFVAQIGGNRIAELHIVFKKKNFRSSAHSAAPPERCSRSILTKSLLFQLPG